MTKSPSQIEVVPHQALKEQSRGIGLKSDLIEELLKEQEQVIADLDELNAKIEAVLRTLAPPPNPVAEPQIDGESAQKRRSA